MKFPDILSAAKLESNSKKRLFIGAYGFEPRSLGWIDLQTKQGAILDDAIIVEYKTPKGENLIEELRQGLTKIGCSKLTNIPYNTYAPYNIEESLSEKLQLFQNRGEIVLDISAMMKLLILVSLCMLEKFTGTLRIVYSELEDYPPNHAY